MKHEFTKKELFEIEKIFDMYTALNTRAIAEITQKLAGIDTPSAKKIVDKLLDEALSAHETFRMISAKAYSMREESVDE